MRTEVETRLPLCSRSRGLRRDSPPDWKGIKKGLYKGKESASEEVTIILMVLQEEEGEDEEDQSEHDGGC